MFVSVLYCHLLNIVLQTISGVSMKSNQLENDVLVAPPGQYRVVGRWPTKSAKPGQYFRHDDYSSLKAALEVATSLNEELSENEGGAYYRVYDDVGLPVLGH